MPKMYRLGLVLVLTLSLYGPARADDAANAWVEKIAARTEQGYYKVRMTADMNLNEGGKAAAMTINGSANFATPQMFRVSLEMNMEMAGSPVPIKMLSVANGETFWIEMDSPMMGGKQVLEGAVGDLERVAQMSGGIGMGGIGSNPVSEIRGIIDRFDMKVVPGSEGHVALQADIPKGGTSGLADLGPFAASATYLRLEIDEKLVMPVKLVIGAAQPIVTMNFLDYEFFSADSVKASDYAYSPPEGVPVRHVSDMLGQ